MTTTASGTRQVAHGRSQVWRAVAVLQAYCPVCDVSYRAAGGAALGKVGRGSTFVCVPGRLEAGRAPAGSAPLGTIVEWRPMSMVETKLELTPELWTTRIELGDAADTGSTSVTITVTHQPTTGGRLTRLVQKTSMMRLVRRMVAAELATIDDHVAAASARQ